MGAAADEEVDLFWAVVNSVEAPQERSRPQKSGNDMEGGSHTPGERLRLRDAAEIARLCSAFASMWQRKVLG